MRKKKKSTELDSQQQILSLLRKMKVLEARLSFLEEENAILKKIVDEFKNISK